MNLKKVLFICLVAYSSSVDLLSVIPKRSVGVSAFIGNEGLINSTMVRDLISTNSSSFVAQMAKADPTQVNAIISLLNILNASVNAERKVFEDDVKTAQAAVNNACERLEDENVKKKIAVRDHAVKVLAYYTGRLANQITIINQVIGIIQVSWYSDGDEKTYEDMNQACVSRKKRLCYYHELCPSKDHLVRAKYPQDNWSPIVMSNTDQNINYVHTGNKFKLCLLLTESSGGDSNLDEDKWPFQPGAMAWRRYYPCCPL